MAALYAVAFLSSLGFSIVMPFMVLLIMRLGGNAFVLGALGAAFWGAQLVGSTWLGALSDRVLLHVPVAPRRTENVPCALLDLIAACAPGSEIGTSAVTAPWSLRFEARCQGPRRPRRRRCPAGWADPRGTRDAVWWDRGAGSPSALYMLHAALR